MQISINADPIRGEKAAHFDLSNIEYRLSLTCQALSQPSSLEYETSTENLIKPIPNNFDDLKEEERRRVHNNSPFEEIVFKHTYSIDWSTGMSSPSDEKYIVSDRETCVRIFKTNF